MIPWKAFWSTLAAAVTFAGAGIAALYTVTLWLALPATVVVAVVVTRVARLAIYRAAVMGGVPLPSRVMMLGWITAATYVHAGVATAFLLRPDLWALWAVVASALGAATYAVARAHEYLLARPSAAPARQELEAQRVEALAAVAADPVRVNLQGGLELGGHGWLKVVDWQPIGGDPDAGEPPYGLEAMLQVPAKRPTASGKAVATMDRAMCEAIAIALSEQLDQPLISDWVTLRKLPFAGLWKLTVLTRDVMADIHPYVDTLEWTSIHTPAMVGYRVDALPYQLMLKSHGQLVGKSTWGKSSLIHTIIGHLTRCHDAVVWVCGTQKLYDLVADWVEPYMDTDEALPIDWIATGQRDTVEMLAAAMTIARWRQSRPMDQRGGWPTIIVILDEASFALGDRTVRIDFEGVPMTASDLVAAHHKGAASGDVHDILASQRDTQDQWGDKGGDVVTNRGWAAGFKTADAGSLGRLLGNYQLPNPRHKGEMLIDGQDGDDIAQVKTTYMQSSDPTKAKLHDGPTIREVAWSRRAFHTALDAGSAAVAGAAYANRHTRMDASMLGYLTNSAGSTTQALPASGTAAPQLAVAGPKAAGYELATRELDALLGVPEPRAVPVAAEVQGVASMVGRQSLADRIVDVVQAAPGPMSRVEIGAAMHPAGEQVVTNALSKLVASGVLSRPERRLYTAALCDAP